MPFVAVYDEKKGWRVVAVGYGRDICGAANETVARQTAAALNDYRERHP